MNVNNIDIKEIVGKDKMVNLVRVKHNALWYVADNGFEFPVPFEDITGETEFLPIEKGMTLMRWVKKHINFLKEAKVEQIA